MRHLFPWVEVTVGAGTNGLTQPANFSTEYSPGAKTTGEGSTSMGFYNVQNGDAPYFKYLADTYAMSDNFHQSVNGGTGANHIMFGHGDAIWFSDGKGHAAVPPNAVTCTKARPTPVWSAKSKTRPRRWYQQLVYRGWLRRRFLWFRSYGGGSYSDCADTSQPGVAPIVTYLNR